MKFVHAFALVLTVLLYLVRQRCAFAGLYPIKRQIFDAIGCSGRSSSVAMMPSQACAVFARSSSNGHSCNRPKYKRDPHIQIDDETIGVLPVE